MILEILAEIFVELLFKVVLWGFLVCPGAFIRWCFTGFRKPFKSLLNDDDVFFNGFLSLCFYIFLGTIIVTIILF
jgi:hypothetical protein